MKHIKVLIVLISVIVVGLPMSAQDTLFASPFDFPIVFSGNFGEIRANHFHGGLDFKTRGVTGKLVHALADGYISRVCVTHGSGYMLYVTYENGYTTINRHLEAFVGEVAQRIEQLQYDNESWEVELIPAPNEYPVRKGQVIGISGNTGYSFGPHLHLDVFRTATGEYVDPMPFFRDKVIDNQPPKALSIMLFPQSGLGVVNGTQKRQTFSLPCKREITAWGVVGVGIRAYDYMEGAANRYGVHTVILEVDGKEVFRSIVDRFFYAENRYINSWVQGQYMKSFIEPGNHLRMLHASNGNRGLITIDEERPYRFVYTLCDALGNTSKVYFTLQGKRMSIPPIQHRNKYTFHWDEVNYLQEPGLFLFIPKGRLYTDAYLNYRMFCDSTAIAYTYQLASPPIALHKSCGLRIGLRHKPVADTTKYYVARINSSGRKTYVGGYYRLGYLEADVNMLGTYTIAVDTVPPIVRPVTPAKWGRQGRIVFKAHDRETAISSYRGTVDGKFVLFGKPNSISGNIECKLNPLRVEKGGKHVVELTVTDACGNTAVCRSDFVW